MFDRNCLRRSLDPSVIAKMRNRDIQEICEQKECVSFLTIKIYIVEVDGDRGKGKPKRDLSECIKELV